MALAIHIFVIKGFDCSNLISRIKKTNHLLVHALNPPSPQKNSAVTPILLLGVNLKSDNICKSNAYK
jgi:hypothetical protein